MKLKQPNTFVKDLFSILRIEDWIAKKNQNLDGTKINFRCDVNVVGKCSFH